MCTQKMRAQSYIGAEKITFPPKPGGHTDIQIDIQTVRRTDISVYRVASLLKITCIYLKGVRRHGEWCPHPPTPIKEISGGIFSVVGYTYPLIHFYWGKPSPLFHPPTPQKRRAIERI